MSTCVFLTVGNTTFLPIVHQNYIGTDSEKNPFFLSVVLSDQNNQRVRQNILNAGIYAQLQTKLFTGFELMAGLRLDNATYFNKGNFSQLVYDELGLRTDNGLSNPLL